MDDFNEPGLATHTEYEVAPSCGGGSSIVWIILFIIAFLAIAGLVVWIVWLYHSRSNCKNNPKDKLTLVNPNIYVNSDSVSLTGTWTNTTNANDKVSLAVTIQPPIFGATGGVVTNAVASNGPVDASAKSVTLTGLQPAVKYYAILVVTNPNSDCFYTYTQLVFMGTSLTNRQFEIQHILQVGKLQAGTNDSVLFSQSPTETSSLWEYTTAGRIQETSTARCLYAGVNNVLAVADCASIGTAGATATSANSTWTYNPSPFSNRWCLSSATAGATGACMVLGTITAPSGTNAGGFATVSVSTNSQAGDAWVNAFQTPAT